MIPAKSTGISDLKEAARSCKKDSAARAAEAARGAEERVGSPRSCHAVQAVLWRLALLPFRRGPELVYPTPCTFPDVHVVQSEITRQCCLTTTNAYLDLSS